MEKKGIPKKQEEKKNKTDFECPICLSTLVLPITLTCGHRLLFCYFSFCEPCIKTKHFKYVKNVCPICRKTIPLKTNYFSVNVLLDQFLQIRNKGQKVTCSRFRLTNKDS